MLRETSGRLLDDLAVMLGKATAITL